MKENKDIQDIATELDNLNGDYEVQRLADIREKALHDEAAALSYAKKHGFKDGVEQGIKQGIEKGIEQGKKETKVSIAKEMLKKGIDIKEIMEITSLTYDEIAKLKK